MILQLEVYVSLFMKKLLATVCLFLIGSMTVSVFSPAFTNPYFMVVMNVSTVIQSFHVQGMEIILQRKRVWKAVRLFCLERLWMRHFLSIPYQDRIFY